MTLAQSQDGNLNGGGFQTSARGSTPPNHPIRYRNVASALNAFTRFVLFTPLLEVPRTSWKFYMCSIRPLFLIATFAGFPFSSPNTFSIWCVHGYGGSPVIVYAATLSRQIGIRPIRNKIVRRLDYQQHEELGGNLFFLRFPHSYSIKNISLHPNQH